MSLMLLALQLYKTIYIYIQEYKVITLFTIKGIINKF